MNFLKPDSVKIKSRSKILRLTRKLFFIQGQGELDSDELTEEKRSKMLRKMMI